MGKSIEEISNTTLVRRQARDPLLRHMMEVQERYDAEWVMPDLGTEAKPFIPQIIADAIDHTAWRAGSVMPNTFCPQLERGVAEGPGSLEYAGIRRRALAYTQDASAFNLSMRVAFRHLAGYATSSFVVIPDDTVHEPRISLRDPLHTFPEPKSPEDISPVSDVAFIFGKSASWICNRYTVNAQGQSIVEHVKSGSRSGSTMWDLIEWIDGEDIVIGLLGPRDVTSIATSLDGFALRPQELRRWKNKAGRCTAVVPQQLTLSKVAASVAKMTHHADLMARMLWLNIIAAEKSTFPDMYIIGRTGAMPRLVGGTWKDGRLIGTEGPNYILDAEGVGQIRSTPDPANMTARSEVERGFRTSTGLVPQMGGEAYGALRTGSAIDALMGAAVDPRLQEMHEIMERAATSVNEIVIDTYKGYWPRRKYTVFSGWSTDDALTEFIPAEHLETTANAVRYAVPGTDIQGLTVALGGMAAADAISMEEFREYHPWVRDPESTRRKVLTEKLEQAGLMQIVARAQQPTGGFTALDLAFLQERLAMGDAWADAIKATDAEARRRQAELAPPPDPTQMMAPEQMPGLGAPGEGGEQPGALPPAPAPPVTIRQMLAAIQSDGAAA